MQNRDTGRLTRHTGAMEYHLPPIGTVATRLAALSAGVQPATIRERTASNCQTYIGR